jgi:hypothetical protein
MRAGIVGVLISVGMASQAIAFSEDGFHSGMSETEALQILARYGSYEQEPGQNVKGYYYMTKHPSQFRAISICNGVVATYQYNIPGGWHAFMRTVERENYAAPTQLSMLPTPLPIPTSIPRSSMAAL